MERKNALHSILAAVLAGCALGAPAATVSATGSFSNLQLRLIDLDPSDGITPTFTITSIGSSASAAFPGQSNPTGLPVSSFLDAGNFATVTSPLGTLGGTSLVAKTTTYSGTAAEHTSEADINGAFTLSAGAEVFFHADAHASIVAPANSTDSYTYLRMDILSTDSNASNHALLVLQKPGEDNVGMTTYFANTGTTPISGTFAIGATAWAAAPVPEPGGGLLLLGGLGLLGARFLRRRARR